MTAVSVSFDKGWKKLNNTLEKFEGELKSRARKATTRSALFVTTRIKKGIRSQAPEGKAFKGLHPWTKQLKGSSKALIDTGDLINAVTHDRISDWAAIVGLIRQKTHKGSKKTTVANIGAIHEGIRREKGTVIEVTDKMRNFMMTQGIFIKPSTTSLVTPARPFIAPVAESRIVNQQVVDNYNDALIGALR